MPQARMYVGTRIVSEEPRSLYAGDIIDGALAAEQVAAGTAEYLPEPETGFATGGTVDLSAHPPILVGESGPESLQRLGDGAK